MIGLNAIIVVLSTIGRSIVMFVKIMDMNFRGPAETRQMTNINTVYGAEKQDIIQRGGAEHRKDDALDDLPSIALRLALSLTAFAFLVEPMTLFYFV